METGARGNQGMQDTNVIGETRTSIDQQLNEIEGAVAEEAKVAVHKIRDQAQQTADQLVEHVGGFWEQAQRTLEAQARQHPWLIFGGLLLVWYLLARRQDSRVG